MKKTVVAKESATQGKKSCLVYSNSYCPISCSYPFPLTHHPDPLPTYPFPYISLTSNFQLPSIAASSKAPSMTAPYAFGPLALPIPCTTLRVARAYWPRSRYLRQKVDCAHRNVTFVGIASTKSLGCSLFAAWRFGLVKV